MSRRCHCIAEEYSESSESDSESESENGSTDSEEEEEEEQEVQRRCSQRSLGQRRCGTGRRQLPSLGCRGVAYHSRLFEDYRGSPLPYEGHLVPPSSKLNDKEGKEGNDYKMTKFNQANNGHMEYTCNNNYDVKYKATTKITTTTTTINTQSNSSRGGLSVHGCCARSLVNYPLLCFD